MGKSLMMVLALVAALFASGGTASAVATGADQVADFYLVTVDEVTIQAWECPIGDLCV